MQVIQFGIITLSATHRFFGILSLEAIGLDCSKTNFLYSVSDENYTFTEKIAEISSKIWYDFLCPETAPITRVAIEFEWILTGVFKIFIIPLELILTPRPQLLTHDANSWMWNYLHDAFSVRWMWSELFRR